MEIRTVEVASLEIPHLKVLKVKHHSLVEIKELQISQIIWEIPQTGVSSDNQTTSPILVGVYSGIQMLQLRQLKAPLVARLRLVYLAEPLQQVS